MKLVEFQQMGDKKHRIQCRGITPTSMPIKSDHDLNYIQRLGNPEQSLWIPLDHANISRLPYTYESHIYRLPKQKNVLLINKHESSTVRISSAEFGYYKNRSIFSPFHDAKNPSYIYTL